MPVYEFICHKCDHNFSLVISISEYEKRKFTCPKCKSDKVKRQLSSFQTITSKKKLSLNWAFLKAVGYQWTFS